MENENNKPNQQLAGITGGQAVNTQLNGSEMEPTAADLNSKAKLAEFSGQQAVSAPTGTPGQGFQGRLVEPQKALDDYSAGGNQTFHLENNPKVKKLSDILGPGCIDDKEQMIKINDYMHNGVSGAGQNQTDPYTLEYRMEDIGTGKILAAIPLNPAQMVTNLFPNMSLSAIAHWREWWPTVDVFLHVYTANVKLNLVATIFKWRTWQELKDTGVGTTNGGEALRILQTTSGMQRTHINTDSRETYGFHMAFPNPSMKRPYKKVFETIDDDRMMDHLVIYATANLMGTLQLLKEDAPVIQMTMSAKINRQQTELTGHCTLDELRRNFTTLSKFMSENGDPSGSPHEHLPDNNDKHHGEGSKDHDKDDLAPEIGLQINHNTLSGKGMTETLKGSHEATFNDNSKTFTAMPEDVATRGANDQIGPKIMDFKKTNSKNKEEKYHLTSIKYTDKYTQKEVGVSNKKHPSFWKNFPTGAWHAERCFVNGGYPHAGHVMVYKQKFAVNKNAKDAVRKWKNFSEASVGDLDFDIKRGKVKITVSNTAPTEAYTQLFKQMNEKQSIQMNVTKHQGSFSASEFEDFCKGKKIGQGEWNQDRLVFHEHSHDFFIAFRIGANYLHKQDNYQCDDAFSSYSEQLMDVKIKSSWAVPKVIDLGVNKAYWDAVTEGREPGTEMWTHDNENYERMSYAMFLRASQDVDWRVKSAIKLNDETWTPYMANKDNTTEFDKNKVSVFGYIDPETEDDYCFELDGPTNYENARVVPNLAKCKNLDDFKKLNEAIMKDLAKEGWSGVVSERAANEVQDPLRHKTRLTKQQFKDAAGTGRSIIGLIVTAITALATVIGEASSKKTKKRKGALPSVRTSDIKDRLPFSFADSSLLDASLEQAEQHLEPLKSLSDFGREIELFYPEWFNGLNRQETQLYLNKTRGPVFAKIYNLLAWQDDEGNFIPHNRKTVDSFPFERLSSTDLDVLGDHKAAFEVLRNSREYIFYNLCLKVCPEIFDDPKYKISETKFRSQAEEQFSSAQDLGLVDTVTARAMWAKLVPLYYAHIDNDRTHTFAEKYNHFLTNPIEPHDFH